MSALASTPVADFGTRELRLCAVVSTGGRNTLVFDGIRQATPSAVQFDYHRHEFDGHAGNVGLKSHQAQMKIRGMPP
jgi:hypothetical protein